MHEAGAHITQRCSATRSSRGEDAVDGSPVQGRDEAHRTAQLDHELVELRGPVLLRQQHRLRCQRGHRDVGPRGEGVALGDEHTERVQPEELGGHRRWGQRGPPDADVEPPVHQTLELLGHARPRPGGSPDRRIAAGPRAGSTPSSRSWHPRLPPAGSAVNGTPAALPPWPVRRGRGSAWRRSGRRRPRRSAAHDGSCGPSTSHRAPVPDAAAVGSARTARCAHGRRPDRNATPRQG